MSAQTEVTLMTRQGCHLCDVAADDLARILPDYGLRATPVDVDSDPELRAEYGDRVPVILIDGKEHGYFRVEESRLRAALEAVAPIRRAAPGTPAQPTRPDDQAGRRGSSW